MRHRGGAVCGAVAFGIAVAIQLIDVMSFDGDGLDEVEVNAVVFNIRGPSWRLREH